MDRKQFLNLINFEELKDVSNFYDHLENRTFEEYNDMLEKGLDIDDYVEKCMIELSLKVDEYIDDLPILLYLNQYQGSWTCFWSYKEESEQTINVAFDKLEKINNEEYDFNIRILKMKSLNNRSLIGGCPCGCRGDFEITDNGLKSINKPRIKEYSGY